ncbi:hypothetical protein EXE43_27900, partial [Halorubrum sp. SS5]
TVDRLAASASSREELTVNRSLTLPNRAAGTGYRIRVTASGTEGTIALESGQTDASVAVPFRTSEGVAVRNVTVDGGDLLI